MTHITGEEVKRLRNRVEALEAITGTASARSSRYSASSAINIVDPLESTYIDRSSSGSTLTRSDNGINLGASGPGLENVPGQDGAALQRTVQQLVRAELRSDAVRGTELLHCDCLSSSEFSSLQPISLSCNY